MALTGRRHGKTRAMLEINHLLAGRVMDGSTHLLYQVTLASLENPEVRYSVQHAKGRLAMKKGRVLHDGGDPDMAHLVRCIVSECLFRAWRGFVFVRDD